MNFDYESRVEAILGTFLAEGLDNVVDEPLLRELLRKFAECDWDAGKDALLDALESDLPTPVNPHLPRTT